MPRRTLSGTKKVVFGTLDGNIGIKECWNVGMLIFLGFSWVLLGILFFLLFFGFLGLSGVFLEKPRKTGSVLDKAPQAPPPQNCTKNLAGFLYSFEGEGPPPSKLYKTLAISY